MIQMWGSLEMCPMDFILFDQFIKDCVSNLRQITKNKILFQDTPRRTRSSTKIFWWMPKYYRASGIYMRRASGLRLTTSSTWRPSLRTWPPCWRTPSSASTWTCSPTPTARQGGHSSSLSSSFLSQLSNKQLSQLYSKYRLDNQLFGYWGRIKIMQESRLRRKREKKIAGTKDVEKKIKEGRNNCQLVVILKIHKLSYCPCLSPGWLMYKVYNYFV